MLKRHFSYIVFFYPWFIFVFFYICLHICYLSIKNRFICHLSSTGDCAVSDSDSMLRLVCLTPPRRTAASSTHIKPPPSTHNRVTPDELSIDRKLGGIQNKEFIKRLTNFSFSCKDCVLVFALKIHQRKEQ